MESMSGGAAKCITGKCCKYLDQRVRRSAAGDEEANVSREVIREVPGEMRLGDSPDWPRKCSIYKIKGTSEYQGNRGMFDGADKQGM